MSRDKDRRDVSEHMPGGEIPALEKRTPRERDRSWDEDKIKATYILPEELKNEIRDIAKEHGKPAYYVARIFLEHGLAAYKGGQLKWQEVKVKDFVLAQGK